VVRIVHNLPAEDKEFSLILKNVEKAMKLSELRSLVSRVLYDTYLPSKNYGLKRPGDKNVLRDDREARLNLEDILDITRADPETIELKYSIEILFDPEIIKKRIVDIKEEKGVILKSSNPSKNPDGPVALLVEIKDQGTSTSIALIDLSEMKLTQFKKLFEKRLTDLKIKNIMCRDGSQLGYQEDSSSNNPLANVIQNQIDGQSIFVDLNVMNGNPISIVICKWENAEKETEEIIELKALPDDILDNFRILINKENIIKCGYKFLKRGINKFQVAGNMEANTKVAEIIDGKIIYVKYVE